MKYLMAKNKTKKGVKEWTQFENEIWLACHFEIAWAYAKKIQLSHTFLELLTYLISLGHHLLKYYMLTVLDIFTGIWYIKSATLENSLL